MMSELFDEEYLRGQYNKSRDREMLAEGRAEGREEERNRLAENLRKMGMTEEQIKRL